MAKREQPPKKRAMQVQNPSTQDDMVWGLNAVLEMLSHNPRGFSELSVLKGKNSPKLQEIIDKARAGDVKLRFVNEDRLNVGPSCRHQGVVGRLSSVSSLSLEELLTITKKSKAGESPRLLVLDSIQDPHNLGAILRSALASGFTGAILTRERSAPLSGTVAKVASGALAQLPVALVVNLSEALKVLKEQGFWVYGTVVDKKAVSIYDCDFSGPVCIVIGGESKGIRPLVQKQCDHFVTIPMQADFNSLNASAAAAVIMFEVLRQQL